MRSLKHEMAEEIRKTGIDIIGDAPWGTHFCQFYETKEDLVDVLVPYFKAGLENNEFCMWVTSEPLSEKEAEKAMRKAVPDFDRYLERGQIEIVPHTEWYLKDGAFNLRRVLNAWIGKLDQALAKGYDGIRVTGNTAWLEKKGWRSFVNYEEEVNDVIGKYRMMAICTYSLDKCGASEVIDVVRNHQFALIKRRGELELIESSERKKAEEALRQSEEKYRSMVELAPDIIVTADLKGAITSINTAGTRISGYSRDEVVGKHFLKIGHIRLVDWPKYLKMLNSFVRGKMLTPSEVTFYHKDGTPRLVEVHASLLKQNGKPTGILAIMRDITERKKTEERIRESEGKLQGIFSTIPDGVTLVGLDGKILDCNDAVLRLHGVSRDEYVGTNVYDFIAPEDRQRAIQEASVVLEKGFIRSEVKAFKKEGGTFDAQINVSLLKDSSGKPTAFLGVTRDITERKKMEEKLRESEERFRNLFESIQDPVGVYVGREGRLIAHNKAFNKLSGYTDEELKDKPFLDFVHPDDHALVLERYRTEYPEEELPLVYEIRAVDKTGKIIPLEISVSTYRVKGKVTGIEVIHRDITERKRTEDAIRESEEKYRDLFENARDVIVAFDLEGNVTSINKAAVEYGFKKDGIVGKSMLEFVPKKYWPRLLKELAEITQGKPVGGEIEIITPKGKKIAEYRSNPIRRGEKVVGLQTTMRDITERKAMEERLRQYSEHLEELVQKRTEELLESEKRYSVLVEEASDGVVIIQDEKFVFANQKAPEIGGYSKDEIIGLPYEKLVDEKYHQYTKELYRGRLRGEKFPATAELEVIAKNGERVPAEISGTLIHYQGRPAILVIVQDIRERKRMEEERLKLEKLATLGELATMVGHDLRNPLQAIENATYYLNNELPRLPSSTPIPQKALEMLQIINDSVNYADKIVRDLHDFSATNKPTLKKININAIVKETLSQVEAPENVKLVTELGHLPEIKTDKDMIKRAFLNLAINGIQAMEKGGTLKVSTKKTKGFIEVGFKDTGIGISKEDMKKLFTPFFTTRAKGMGMGLPICKKFIEIHGGSIEVESQEGKGSTFTVKLPIQQDNGGENLGEG